MSKLQRSRRQKSGSADWTPEPGEVITLSIGTGPRWVQAAHRRAWITQSATGTDHWVERGDTLWFGGGSTLVMEAWPSARFALLVPPQACAARANLIEFGHRLAQSAGGIWPRPLKSCHVQQCRFSG